LTGLEDGDPRPPLVVALDGTCRLGPAEIGGKAWGVNRMRALGLPVPPAIAATIHACHAYFAAGSVVDGELRDRLAAALKLLEDATGRRLGDHARPLLVSVRSGAAHSMPGMMDTVLDLGLDDRVEAALAAETGDAAFAADTRRRFVAQYRKVVLGGRDDAVPDDPWTQLLAAVAAVFDSWHSARARVYRNHRGFSENGGTAVTIQAMVFGNRDARSGTGVLFSRNPITGDPPAWGEWLPRGQGEDIVAGAFTPGTLDALREQMPDVHAGLLRAAATLEADARDLQDIEYTVESGRLWLLQTRVAKRSPQAAARAAVAFAEAGLISPEAAVRRIGVEQARQLRAPRLASQAPDAQPLAIGEAACPGVATGVVVTDPDEAEARARRGDDVILARTTTSPEDLHGIVAARGLMTELGGATSHAAVLSRELGRPCVVGCGPDTVTRLAGRRVTLDGTTGRIRAGDLAVELPDEAAIPDLRRLLEWGLALAPVPLLRPGDVTGEVIDLDALGDDWRAGLRRGVTVRGRVLDTDEGVCAAVAAGVGAVVVRNRLPALLAMLHGPSRTGSGAAPVAVAAAPAAASADLALLRLLGLKGRAPAEFLADALSLSVDAAAARYDSMARHGWCARVGTGWQLTHTGQAHVAALLESERARADVDAVASLYAEFGEINTTLKQVMTAWQIRPDGTPNDHADAAYDSGVLGDLAELHARAMPLLERLSTLSPRLATYPVRLARALRRVEGGDRGYVARIIADSYHTVWFELHRELIALAGLDAVTEDRAGRSG
jgi:pyruvate,orthophosphate dikinase